MMVRPLNEQVVVITGASSGIGREAALRFARQGASVVLAARNTLALNEVAAAIHAEGGRAHVVTTDVRDWAQMQRLADEAARVYGRIDTWINGAALAIYATTDDTTPEEFAQLLHTNVLGVVHGTKAALPHLRRAGEGTIINVGSVASQRALPYLAAYSASKHAVKGFTEAFRLEMKREKATIHVTLVLPSAVNTPFFNHARSKLGVMPRPFPPAYRPELAADALVYAARRPQRDIYVGGAGWLFALGERLSPALMDSLLGAGNLAMRLQKSGKPDDGADNFGAPLDGPGRVHGDFRHLAKPSLFTRIFELTPTWRRVALSSVAAMATLFLLNRRA